MLDRNPNKKAKKAKDKKKRVLILFNTGIRTHKSKKDYNRKKFKKIENEDWQISCFVLIYNQKKEREENKMFEMIIGSVMVILSTIFVLVSAMPVIKEKENKICFRFGTGFLMIAWVLFFYMIIC